MEELKGSVKMDEESGSTSWEAIYQECKLENLPWYIQRLDADLSVALTDRDISSGSFLDIGTGPGTQATELTKRGFTVTAIDLAESALQKAKIRAGALAGKVNWLVDDIVDTKIKERFDYIFDRGCFHTLLDNERAVYVKNVKKILAPDGLFFLKCFSSADLFAQAARFSPLDLEDIFGKEFRVETIRHTYFNGPQIYKPKALFCEISPKTHHSL